MSDPAGSLAPLAILLRFLRFGLLAWGGPVAQIAMLKRELVEREQWLEPQRFARLIALYQLLPGPEAHELCVHLGMLKGRRLGGLLAGLGFMMPGLLLMLALAAAYQRINLDQTAVGATFAGVQAGVVALIVRGVHRIAEHALSSQTLWAIAGASAAATALGVSFWVPLLAGGLLAAAIAGRRFAVAILVLAAAVLAGTATADSETSAAVLAVAVTKPGMVELFWSGLKAGLLTFGGAYAAIPFVRADAVGRGWVSEAQFLDGLALAAIIPAPLIIFTAFVGYVAGGLGGALAITAGVFLPAFGFGLLFFERLEALVDHQRLHRFLEGVAAAVIGLMAVTAFEIAADLAHTSSNWPVIAALMAGALALVYAWRSNWAVPGVILSTGTAGLLLLG